MANVGTRLIAGIAWVIGGLLVLCVLPGNVFFLGIDYLERNGSRVPDEVLMTYSIVAFAGMAIIPSFFAVMALRGKLPGTRPRDSGDQTNDTEPHTK